MCNECRSKVYIHAGWRPVSDVTHKPQSVTSDVQASCHQAKMSESDMLGDEFVTGTLLFKGSLSLCITLQGKNNT